MTRKLQLNKALVADLTVGELEELETRTNRPLSKLFDDDAPRGILLHTLAYIALRREEPSTSWEEAGEVRVELQDDDAEEVVEATGPTPAGRGKRNG